MTNRRLDSDWKDLGSTTKSKKEMDAIYDRWNCPEVSSDDDVARMLEADRAGVEYAATRSVAHLSPGDFKKLNQELGFDKGDP